MREAQSITLDIDAAESLPLDLATLKTDLRIDGSDLDSILRQQYIPAALAWAEGFTRRSLIARTHRWIITRFPSTYRQVIMLPRGKIQSVTSIAYKTNGGTVTLTGPSSGSPGGTDYQEDLRGHVGRVMPNQGESWPAVDDDVLDPVVITFEAGYASESDIPADLKRALTAYVYQTLDLDGLVNMRPNFDIEFPEKLLSPYRVAHTL